MHLFIKIFTSCFFQGGLQVTIKRVPSNWRQLGLYWGMKVPLPITGHLSFITGVSGMMPRSAMASTSSFPSACQAFQKVHGNRQAPAHQGFWLPTGDLIFLYRQLPLLILFPSIFLTLIPLAACTWASSADVVASASQGVYFGVMSYLRIPRVPASPKRITTPDLA